METGIFATIGLEYPPRRHSHSTATWESLAAQAHYRAGDLARLLSVSLRTLQRYFRVKYNCTVSDWLRELRLESARLRLPSSGSVKEVAFDLGYKQPSHFTRDFKQRFGVSPRTFVVGRMALVDA